MLHHCCLFGILIGTPILLDILTCDVLGDRSSRGIVQRQVGLFRQLQTGACAPHIRFQNHRSRLLASLLWQKEIPWCDRVRFSAWNVVCRPIRVMYCVHAAAAGLGVRQGAEQSRSPHRALFGSAGWCDFAQISTVTDEHQGFTSNDTVVVLAEILVLNETVSFTREAELAASASTAIVPVRLDGLQAMVTEIGVWSQQVAHIVTLSHRHLPCEHTLSQW